MNKRKEYNRQDCPVVNSGFNIRYAIVQLHNFTSNDYGIYTSMEEAQAAQKHAYEVNSDSKFYIETRFVPYE